MTKKYNLALTLLIAISGITLFFLGQNQALAKRKEFTVYNCSGYSANVFRKNVDHILSFGGFVHVISIGSSQTIKCVSYKEQHKQYCNMRAYYSRINEGLEHHREKSWARKIDIDRAKQAGGVCIRAVKQRNSFGGITPVPALTHYCSSCNNYQKTTDYTLSNHKDKDDVLRKEGKYYIN